MSKGIEKLPDGFTHKPVFLIRSLLRQLPAYYVAQTLNRVDDESAYMPDDIFLRVTAASYVGKRDLQLTPSRSAHVKNFQQCYLRLIASLGEPFDEVLKTLQERSAVINHRHRLTGDALVVIIEEVIALKGKIKVDGLQEALDAFIDSQVLVPGDGSRSLLSNLNRRTSNPASSLRFKRTSRNTRNPSEVEGSVLEPRIVLSDTAISLYSPSPSPNNRVLLSERYFWIPVSPTETV